MSKLTSDSAAICHRYVAYRQSRKTDLSSTLFVNVFGRQSELRNLVDTSGQESDERRNPFGTYRTTRFVVLMTVAFVLIVLATYGLIVQFGGPDPHQLGIP